MEFEPPINRTVKFSDLISQEIIESQKDEFESFDPIDFDKAIKENRESPVETPEGFVLSRNGRLSYLEKINGFEVGVFIGSSLVSRATREDPLNSFEKLSNLNLDDRYYAVNNLKYPRFKYKRNNCGDYFNYSFDKFKTLLNNECNDIHYIDTHDGFISYMNIVDNLELPINVMHLYLTIKIYSLQT